MNRGGEGGLDKGMGRRGDRGREIGRDRRIDGGIESGFVVSSSGYPAPCPV
jgi:hypothetical protein